MKEDNSQDGSIRGWLIVVASFTMHTYYVGILVTSGLFMVEFLRYFEDGAETVSWMFTAASLMAAAIAPAVGYLVSKCGARKTAIVGAIIATLAMLVSSFAQSLAHLMVTFGILQAIGLVTMFIPALSIVAQYFTKRYALANGLSGLGASVGAIAFPPLIEALIQQYGWHGAFLITSGIAANNLVAAAIMKPAPRDRNDVPLNKSPRESEDVDSEDCTTENDRALQNLPHSSNLNEPGSTPDEHNEEIISRKPNDSLVAKVFLMIPHFCGCSLVHKTPLYGGLLVFVILYTSSCQMGMMWRVIHAVAVGIPRMKAATLVTFFGVTSAVGRVGHGWLVDYKIISPMTLMSLMLIALSISSLVFAFLESYAFMAACCAVIGLCQGIATTLINVCTRQIVGLHDLPRAIGIQFTAAGLGSLLLPVAGKLYESTEDTRTPFYLTFACSLASALIFVAVSLVYRRKSTERTVTVESGEVSKD
ncbi:monocarboxylate transporter 12-like [Ptychodera flava]|uniref:monocarboxylate transporter 12-like n=1 Tax=Ptychodera flava TaxID=63121 RepID=UPI003969D3BE